MAIVERFLRIGEHDRQMVSWRRVQKTNGVGLRKEAMSYSRAAELVKKEIKAEGLDPRQYGLHSLRSGGASTAAALGISDRLLQRQGGRHTATAKNNYISESLDTTNSYKIYADKLTLAKKMTLSLCSCGGWLQQLPVVCEKCYFLLAEARNKQKMFSHPPPPWGLFKERVLRVFKHILLLRSPLLDKTPAPPVCLKPLLVGILFIFEDVVNF